jgi:malyl-CoA/(S)-citramalyl-CoA lyase
MSFTMVEPAPARLSRRELAVPGIRPHLFDKAASSPADVVFLGLAEIGRARRIVAAG